MIELNVGKYLSEIDEKLEKIIKEKKLVFIKAMPGVGKTYWIGNILMKRYTRILNVNFLNVLNSQNFQDSFVEGESGAKSIDGSKAATINVQNLGFVNTNAFDIVIIDEIHKTNFDSWRDCCKELPDLIRKFSKMGKTIIVFTGTPVKDYSLWDELGFEYVSVNKKNIKREDIYNYNFVKGLNKRNFTQVIKDRLKYGVDGIILISNQNREKLANVLNRAGITYEEMYSDLRGKEGSRLYKLVKGVKNEETNNTEYLLMNDDDETEVFLSTSVMVEGLNIQDTERKIEVITFLDEIETPMNIIQAAGRMRNQVKSIYVGYRDEEDFNLNYFRTVFSNIDNDATKDETESLLASQFNSFEDWESYFKENSVCKIKKLTMSDFEIEETDKEVDSKKKTDWKKWACEIEKIVKREKPIISKRIESITDKDGCFYIELSPNKNTYKSYTTDPELAKQLISLIELGFSISNMDSNRMKEAGFMMRLVKVIKSSIWYEINNCADFGSRKGWNDTIDEIVRGKFSDTDWNNLINHIFDFTYKLNGETVDLKDAEMLAKYSKDKKKKIDKPAEMITDYKETILSVLAKSLGRKHIYTAHRMEQGEFWLDALCFDVNKIFEEDYNNRSNKLKAIKTANKGANKGKAKKTKYVMKSNNSIEFLTIKEAYEYLLKEGTYNKSLKSFKNRDNTSYIDKRDI